jgi:hypothetical protein
MRITSSGDVGIGTFSSGYKLGVSGDALINSLRFGRGNGNLVENTAIGLSVLNNNTSGNYNTAVGAVSMLSNTSGTYNTAVGYSSLSDNNSGQFNTAIGFGAVAANQIGNNNIGIGAYSLSGNTEGSNNLVIGVSAGQSIVGGSQNIIIGNGLDYYPTGNSFNGDNTLSISKNSDDYFGYPHFWAPTTIGVGDGGSTPILVIDPNVYSGFFLDYVFQEASSNNIMRSGTIRAVFLADMSVINWSETDILSIGSASGVTFRVYNNGTQISVDIDANLGNGEVTNINLTSRLILRAVY